MVPGTSTSGLASHLSSASPFHTPCGHRRHDASITSYRALTHLPVTRLRSGRGKARGGAWDHRCGYRREACNDYRYNRRMPPSSPLNRALLAAMLICPAGGSVASDEPRAECPVEGDLIHWVADYCMASINTDVAALINAPATPRRPRPPRSPIGVLREYDQRRRIRWMRLSHGRFITWRYESRLQT